MFRLYIRVCLSPGAAIPLAASFIGALAINMQALAVLLVIQRASGSFARAGVVAAALSLGAAAGLVGQGRLLDRYGQARVLAGTAATCGIALVLLTIAARAGHGLPVVSLLGVVAGASVPAVPSAMRILVPRLVSDPDLRRAAYALLAVQFQAATVLGPLLAAGLVLVAGAPGAVLTAGALAVGAAAGFAAAAPSAPSRAMQSGAVAARRRALLVPLACARCWCRLSALVPSVGWWG